jgi:hypothetical protein
VIVLGTVLYRKPDSLSRKSVQRQWTVLKIIIDCDFDKLVQTRQRSELQIGADWNSRIRWIESLACYSTHIGIRCDTILDVNSCSLGTFLGYRLAAGA